MPLKGMMMGYFGDVFPYVVLLITHSSWSIRGMRYRHSAMDMETPNPQDHVVKPFE